MKVRLVSIILLYIEFYYILVIINKVSTYDTTTLRCPRSQNLNEKNRNYSFKDFIQSKLKSRIFSNHEVCNKLKDNNRQIFPKSFLELRKPSVFNNKKKENNEIGTYLPEDDYDGSSEKSSSVDYDQSSEKSKDDDRENFDDYNESESDEIEAKNYEDTSQTNSDEDDPNNSESINGNADDEKNVENLTEQNPKFDYNDFVNQKIDPNMKYQSISRQLIPKYDSKTICQSINCQESHSRIDIHDNNGIDCSEAKLCEKCKDLHSSVDRASICEENLGKIYGSDSSIHTLVLDKGSCVSEEMISTKEQIPLSFNWESSNREMNIDNCIIDGKQLDKAWLLLQQTGKIPHVPMYHSVAVIIIVKKTIHGIENKIEDGLMTIKIKYIDEFGMSSDEITGVFTTNNFDPPTCLQNESEYYISDKIEDGSAIYFVGWISVPRQRKFVARENIEISASCNSEASCDMKRYILCAKIACTISNPEVEERVKLIDFSMSETINTQIDPIYTSNNIVSVDVSHAIRRMPKSMSHAWNDIIDDVLTKSDINLNEKTNPSNIFELLELHENRKKFNRIHLNFVLFIVLGLIVFLCLLRNK